MDTQIKFASLATLLCIAALTTPASAADTNNYRVYVPNNGDGTISVIDPQTYKVTDTYPADNNPLYIIPSNDLSTLWVINDRSNNIRPIDPRTGTLGNTVAVDDPYNMYFTPDGKHAMVISEGRRQIQLRDPKTMQLEAIIHTACTGANHMAVSEKGHFAIVTCEYSGQLMKLDLDNFKVLGYLSLQDKPHATKTTTSDITPEFTISEEGEVQLPASPAAYSMPQDIRASSDGKYFYVADKIKDGVIIIDPVKFTKVGFIPTGVGTHAIYPSRNGKLFYVSNRGCRQYECAPHSQGSISVIDPSQKKVVATWVIPNGGSPGSGNLTPDGKELWLSGRYDKEVYVFNTTTGTLTHRISVGNNPRSLTLWSKPSDLALESTAPLPIVNIGFTS